MLFSNILWVHSACLNDCNKKGTCGIWQNCQCFDGWEGNDCSRKTCPKGPQLADIASSLDTAHGLATCSGQGYCDYATGNCKCNQGYYGNSCERTKCFKNCNYRGRCMSLRMVAEENDGFRLNRTTTYDQWDADVIFGCVCDPGWSGPDCSQRVCEYGLDPRLEGKPKEVVTLVCSCEPTCSGKFKLKFMGYTTRTWLKPTSRAFELANAIMSIPGVFTNNSGHVPIPVIAANSSADDMICADDSVTKTTITFRRNVGDQPAVSFYANLITGGSLYFETKQTLKCDCVDDRCNGTFRLSFDGEMSPKLRTWENGTSVAYALRSMNTINSAGVIVALGEEGPICVPGTINNYTITFKAALGNVPRLGLWSSVVKNKKPKYYSLSNTSNVLTLETDDGRNDNIKLCNGVGKCNFETGVCTCPFGWGFDADVGPCGRLQVNTSRWNGLARCPGVVAATSTNSDQSGRQNFETRIYLALNPSVNESNPYDTSGIYFFQWKSDTLIGPNIDETTREFFLNLTSNVSAGPLVIDQAKNRMFFVDLNPNASFIGVASLKDKQNYTVYIPLDYEIFGFTMNADFNSRTLYWSVPGTYSNADGALYYASADETYPTVYKLLPSIGQNGVVHPHGIAIHYLKNRIFWVDRNITTDNSVLRSCNFDGSEYKEVYVYRTIGNHSVSTNLTDLVIDFSHNNTAFFIDNAFPAAILTTNLDFPISFNNQTQSGIDQFLGMLHTRVVVSHWQIPMGNPRYLSLDEQTFLVFWSDIDLKSIGFARYIRVFKDLFNPGTAFQALEANGVSLPLFATGMVFDRGFGRPEWGNYIDCYGNGRCMGLEGNFECRCNKGFYGDCQARTCPLGRSWFGEPAANDVAHDEYAECSNMGVCNRATGTCSCRSGFQGSACERLSCSGRSEYGPVCNGRGRCISMRKLALTHKDEYLNPKPVTYGSKARDPATWEADMIHGCHADFYGSFEGQYNITSATGPALTQVECPSGYNSRLLDRVLSTSGSSVLTTNYTNTREIQEIKCLASLGQFTLTFRGYTTKPISFNTTASELKRRLEELPVIGEVDVSYNDDHRALCSTTVDAAANITFLSLLGLVPLLEVSTSAVFGRPATVTVQRIQASTLNGLLECAGYGECDSGSGLCRCYKNYGTSDGFGNKGNRGDCGSTLIT